MNRDLGLRRCQLQAAAEAFLDLRRQILPAGESIFARDDELRVAIGEWHCRSRQLHVNAGEGFGSSGGGVAGEFLRLLAKRVERRACGQISSSGHGASFHVTQVPAE